MALTRVNLALANNGIVAKTANYTAKLNDNLILCSGSAFTVTLPAAASSAGKIFEIMKTDAPVANLITIDANASELINGRLTVVLSAQYQRVKIVCDGTGWLVMEFNAAGEFLSATSVLKTPVATTTYAAFTTGNVTITPGRWRIWGFTRFSSAGNAGYSEMVSDFRSTNGADNTTIPTKLQATTNLTVLSASDLKDQSFTPGLWDTSTPGYVVDATASVPIYGMALAIMATPANARFQVFVNAERIGI